MNETRHTEACGSARGYQRHRRNREAPCPACLRANSENSIASRIGAGHQDVVTVDVRTLGLLLHNADLRTAQRARNAIGQRTATACVGRFLQR